MKTYLSFGLFLFLLIFGREVYSQHMYNFMDILNFQDANNSYISFRDYNNFSYSHEVNIDPTSIILLSADLQLSHYGNRNNQNENWFIDVGTESFNLGSSDNFWQTEIFQLSPSALLYMSTSYPMNLHIGFSETTTGNDGIRISESLLSGTYTRIASDTGVIPEPSSLLSSSLGIFIFYGLCQIRRKLKKELKQLP